MPKERCFVYYSPGSSCSWDKLKDYLANATPPCVDTSLSQVESYPTRVRIKSSDTKDKRVSFGYKFIECAELRTKGRHVYDCSCRIENMHIAHTAETLRILLLQIRCCDYSNRRQKKFSR